MPIFKIPLRIKRLISNKITGLFDSVKSKFLSPRFKETYGFDRSQSLPGMYEQASKDEGGIPSIETVETLIEASDKYFNSLKDKTVNKVIADLETNLTDDVDAESLSNSISNSLSDVKFEVKRIVESQLQASKNIGLADGILRRNAVLGVDDPTVAFIPVKNRADVCEECMKLHVMPDGITPRVYKFSELTAGYHQKGSDVPSVHGGHPNCRCTLITLLPGFGLKDGKIAYVSKGHDEYKNQKDE